VRGTARERETRIFVTAQARSEVEAWVRHAAPTATERQLPTLD